MPRIQALLWAALAACWVVPILRLCQVIGGCQWLGHMGQAGAAATAAAMVALCVLAAIANISHGGVPGVVKLAIVLASSLHLFQAVGFYILTSSNGHASPLVLLPFALVSAVFPSVIVTGNGAVMAALYVALPLFCLALALSARRPSRAEPHAGA